MWIVIQTILCYFAADFVSGLVHWWEDRYITSNTPLVGSWVGKPNELHHLSPRSFLQGTYWYRNQHVILISLGASAIALLASYRLALVFLITSQSNELHAWSHQRCNKFIRTLQRWGILISVKQHAEHHVPNHLDRYCTVSSYLNPILDRIKFWRGLETAVYIISGIRPVEKK